MINTPTLKITTIDSKISVQKRDAKLNIKGIQADVDIQKRPHKFRVETEAAKVEIDNYPAFRQLDNSKNPMDMEAKFSSESKQDGMRAIAQYSSEGDQMMKIEKSNGNTLANISFKRAFSDLQRSVGLEHFPKENIKINVRPGKVTSQYIPGSMETRVRKNLQISSVPGRFKISANYPKVITEVKGNNINYKA